MPGDYVYGLDGTTASYTDEVSVTERSRGDRVRVDSRSDRSASRTTSLLSWQPGGVFMELRRIAVSDDLVFECTFDPQIPLLRFPLERADYPSVEWETDTCSGSIDVSVVGREELAAANRSWRVWRVETNLNLMMRSGEHEFTIDYEEASWWAPELRKEVKRDRRSAGNLDGYRTSDRVVPVLESYPRVSE